MMDGLKEKEKFIMLISLLLQENMLFNFMTLDKTKF